MPSPFPGMDPYLEDPDVFPDFHDSFVTYLRESLQPQLPEPYFTLRPSAGACGSKCRNGLSDRTCICWPSVFRRIVAGQLAVAWPSPIGLSPSR